MSGDCQWAVLTLHGPGPVEVEAKRGIRFDGCLMRLLAVVLFATWLAVGAGAGSNWAVLVSTSTSWFNYRVRCWRARFTADETT